VNVQIIIGVILYVVGFLSWLYILSKVNLSVAYPTMTTLSFITILLLSIILLKEKLTLEIIIGSILCLIGIYIILKSSNIA
jgi:drug/metabolite transporter (DMT)-like permease